MNFDRFRSEPWSETLPGSRDMSEEPREHFDALDTRILPQQVSCVTGDPVSPAVSPASLPAAEPRNVLRLSSPGRGSGRHSICGTAGSGRDGTGRERKG